MSYSDVALLAQDTDFTLRTRAAVSQEGELDPITWSNTYAWAMAGAPGFGEKYAYAMDTNVPRPGWDESVIPDADILAAVQALRNAPPE